MAAVIDSSSKNAAAAKHCSSKHGSGETRQQGNTVAAKHGSSKAQQQRSRETAATRTHSSSKAARHANWHCLSSITQGKVLVLTSRRKQERHVVVQEAVMASPVLQVGHKVTLVQELVLAMPALKVVVCWDIELLRWCERLLWLCLPPQEGVGVDA